MTNTPTDDRQGHSPVDNTEEKTERTTVTTASGILLVAHGSRVETSNAEVAALAERLKSRLTTAENSDSSDPIVRHAFLELTEPTIAQVIDECAAEGVKHLHVLPYFLAAGTHVRKDIPATLESAGERHPEMTLTLSTHVGKSDAMLDLLISLVTPST